MPSISKRSLHPVWRVICGALLSLAIAFPGAAYADDPPPAQPDNAVRGLTDDTTRARYAPVLAELEEQAVAVRGLTPLREVPLEVIDRPELRRQIAESVSEADLDTVRAQLGASAERQLLILLGLIEPQTDLVDVAIEQSGSGFAGLYMPDKKSMLVIAEDVASLAPPDKAVYVHEFGHALQDQYFDLTALLGGSEDDEDGRMARRALVEGDATLLAALWTDQYLGQDAMRDWYRQQNEQNRQRQQAEREAAGEGGGAPPVPVPAPPPPSAPGFLQVQTEFQYADGYRFARQAYDQGGGYFAVDELFRRPPATTEQVLHPEKYWAGEGPMEVQLPDLTAALGAGWREVRSSTLGELDLFSLLREHVDAQPARLGAAGWGGGRWWLLEHSAPGADGRATAGGGTAVAETEDATAAGLTATSGSLGVVIKTTWDSELDAREFFDVYAHGLRVRFPDADQTALAFTHQALTDVGREGASGMATELLVKGRDVLAVIAVDRPTAGALLAAVLDQGGF